MKKFWKISAICVGSIVGLAVVAVCVALWMVFTPARMTPIVQEQLPRFITAPAQIERVELTFFSTFPRFCLGVDGVTVVNHIEGAPGDTLARVGRLEAAIDIRALMRRGEIILSDVALRDGAVNLYTDARGRTNYDIVKSEPDADTTATGFTTPRVEVDRVRIERFDVRWVDEQSLLTASVTGLSGDLAALFDGEAMSATVDVAAPFDVEFGMGRADSLLAATLRGVTLAVSGVMRGDEAEADVTQFGVAGATVVYGGERYLADAPIALVAAAGGDLAAGTYNIRGASLDLAGLGIALDGTVRLDAGGVAGAIDSDLNYKFEGWTLADVLALVPPAFASYLDGITAEGTLSSEGTVNGVYAAATADRPGTTPTVEANVSFADGRVSYPAMLPWPLRDVAADLTIKTDMTDAASSVRINSLAARTRRSSLRARGSVVSLLSDPRADITADLDADLADAAPFIPDSLRLTAAGRVAGSVKADVRMSQLAAMALDRMKLSGDLTVTGLDAVYDTIAVAAPSARLAFALPNANPSTRFTTFASATIETDRLTASAGDNTRVEMEGAGVVVETSNLLDTVRTPSVYLNTVFSHLAARADTISVDAGHTGMVLSTESNLRATGEHNFRVDFTTPERLSATMGAMSARVDTLGLVAAINYDPRRGDHLWQKFQPLGSMVVSGASVSVPSLDYPVRMPSLEMEFNPLEFRVMKARALLDQSDFSLSGTIDNIDAWFRGDDILRAEFDFRSPVTNVTQLLALTSGLGDETLETGKAGDATPPDVFTGPYMVPKGVDLTLHADIGEVLWHGESLLTGVRGDVQVHDGVLFITPEVAFTSPVTTGNIQLMYRTPAKNNLFAGVGVHLDRIDMAELVRLIPDLDRLMPALRGFSGTGEFHCAVEGYMDSTYRFKMSTLRGAGSIAAVDLALRDEELFRRIAVLLKYRDQSTLRIDSMRAEFTVLRNEINLYPFLLKVDRYGAVIGGRHNLDQTFDYNISLVESPLPFRVAVDVTGSADDLRFKVFSRSRYPDFYRPRYEGVVENRQMELRNLIRNSLLAGRKEDE
ncbi:MAG: hypothetical protein LBU98_01035 [Alistipes sp.]|jgi:hypothetical protein|nr:hypothetical protein [Alistipes sp.]